MIYPRTQAKLFYFEAQKWDFSQEMAITRLFWKNMVIWIATVDC